MERSGGGLWVGATVIALASGFAMVQLRCKLGTGYPCGDWAADGVTWHILPPVVLGLVVWGAVAVALGQRTGTSPLSVADRLGAAAAPGLGLTVAWTWYGITAPSLHAPVCTTPVLCHDALPHAVLVWTLPWIAWAGWRVLEEIRTLAVAQ